MSGSKGATGSAKGKLYIIGLGPGERAQMTGAALGALARADLVVGYHAYVELLGDLVDGKETFTSSMMEEVERADAAIVAAQAGRTVAVVASGDACVFGLGGLVLERLSEADRDSLHMEILPGVTAANAAASLLGAPLAVDYLVLSLSDLLTDRELILRRLRAARDGDLAVVLYNPMSASRRTLLPEARRILLEARPASTPVGIVRAAYRKDQRVALTTLGELEGLMEGVDMSSVVVIASSRAERRGDWIVEPRGYE